MLVIQLGITAWHFLGTTNQNVLKIMMLYRNIFTSARATTFLCKTVPTAKDTPKLGTIVDTHYQKQRKISAPSFQSKFEVGMKKKLSQWYSSCCWLSLKISKIFTHKHVHVHTHMHARMHTHTHTCTCTCACKHTNTLTHTQQTSQRLCVLHHDQ